MKNIFVSSLLASAFGILSACGIQVAEDSSLLVSEQAQQQPQQQQQLTGASDEVLKSTRFHLITPTGQKIFAAMKQWEKGQELEAKKFAQPAMCAANASRVLEMAGIKSYSSPLLITMVNQVRKRGGLVIELPKNPQQIAQTIRTVFNGKIPVGSFISGCLNKDCSGQAGDGHIALVGDIDESGYIKIYHNNWYRPDNNREKKWYPHMIPLDWYKSGLLRKWMATPWIYLHRDAVGAPNDIKVRLPEIDDLDPTNYYVTLTVPVEIMNEVKNNMGVVTDGKGGIQKFTVSSAPAAKVCNTVRISDPSDPAGVNLRSTPSGQIQCQLANGTSAELLASEGLWSRVRVQCGGSLKEGFVFRAFAEKECR